MKEKLQLTPQKLKKDHEKKKIIKDYYEQLNSNKMNNLEEMNKCLQTYSLPKLNEKENTDKPNNNNGTESVKNILNKVHDQTTSQVNPTI